MKLREKNKVKYFIFPELEETGLLRHGFSTKIGGVSSGCFGTMNLSFTRGDEEKKVLENFNRFCKAIGTKSDRIVMTKQTHNINIERVGKNDRGNGIFRPNKFLDCDGIMTNEPGVLLTTLHADCPAIFILDTKNKAIALVHSGWRGTVRKIAQRAVYKMEKEFGSRPSDLVCAISPGIGKCCFQIDYPVVSEFKKSFDFAEEFISPDFGVPGKYKLDLEGINKEMLKACGVKTILSSGICTMCNSDLFFSHRREGEARGSMAAFIELKEE